MFTRFLRESPDIQSKSSASRVHPARHMTDDEYDLIGRAQKYAAAAFAFYEQFPYSSKAWYAANQFYRASSSATSNYCAAKRGRSTAEFISKLGTVVEEIDEAVRWLEHMRDIRVAVDANLFSEAEQLRRIWGASLGTARRNEKARQQRLKDAGAKRPREKRSKPRRYPDPT
jgi:four helix bundle protein